MTEAAHDRTVLVHFDRALSRLGQTLERALPGALDEVAGDLELAAEQVAAQRDRLSLTTAAGRLRMERDQRVAHALQDLVIHADRLAAAAHPNTGHPHAGSQTLTLLLEEGGEQQLLVDDLARAVRQSAAGDFVTFSERINALWPGRADNDDINPVGARTLAVTSLQALALSGMTADTQLHWRRSLLRRLPGALAGAIADLNRWLSGHSVGSPDAGVLSRPEASALVAEHGLAPSAHLPGAVTREVHPGGGLPTWAAQNGSPLMPTLQPVVELERDAIAFAHSLGVVPYGRDARSRFFRNARERLAEARGAPAQLAVVDVVAAMFNYVIDDRRLPDAVKPLLWRLQQPALALALMDPAYLGDEPRSLRRLIESIGAIAQTYADDPGQGKELNERLETVIRAVEVVAGALQSRAAVMARQIDQEYGRAAQSVAHLIDRLDSQRAELEATRANQNRRNYRQRPSPEREQEVTVRLSVMLGERLERHRVPASVREFLLTVWLRQLRTAALRNGEESGEFKVAMQVVDDLLWSLDTSAVSGGRRELAVRIPPLIRLLTLGSRQSGVKDEELKPFFDELFLVHLRKMQGGGETASPAPTRLPENPPAARLPEQTAAASDSEPAVERPEPYITPSHPDGPLRLRAPDSASIGRRSSDRSVTLARTPSVDLARAGDRRVRARPSGAVAQDGDGAAESNAPDHRLLEVLSSIDLADLPPSPAVEPVVGTDPMSRLARGRWIEMVAHDGIHSFAKVAWINARRTVVLLVRHPDRRALSLRSTEMVERFAQGRAFLIE